MVKYRIRAEPILNQVYEQLGYMRLAAGDSGDWRKIGTGVRTWRVFRALRMLRLLKLQTIFAKIYDKIDSELTFGAVGLVRFFCASF